MKIGDLEFPDVFVEALCLHRIFAAAGIPSDDVWVIPRCVDRDSGEEQLGVQARQGERTFTVTVGKVGMSEDEFSRLWAAAARVYCGLSGEEQATLTDKAAVRSRAAEIFAAMYVKGFSIVGGPQ